MSARLRAESAQISAGPRVARPRRYVSGDADAGGLRVFSLIARRRISCVRIAIKYSRYLCARLNNWKHAWPALFCSPSLCARDVIMSDARRSTASWKKLARVFGGNLYVLDRVKVLCRGFYPHLRLIAPEYLSPIEAPLIIPGQSTWYFCAGSRRIPRRIGCRYAGRLHSTHNCLEISS